MKKTKIADLIKYHKEEASEPFLTLKGLSKLNTTLEDKMSIKRVLNNYKRMMKKKHLEWIKILEKIWQESYPVDSEDEGHNRYTNSRYYEQHSNS